MQSKEVQSLKLSEVWHSYREKIVWVRERSVSWLTLGIWKCWQYVCSPGQMRGHFAKYWTTKSYDNNCGVVSNCSCRYSPGKRQWEDRKINKRDESWGQEEPSIEMATKELLNCSFYWNISNLVSCDIPLPSNLNPWQPSSIQKAMHGFPSMEWLGGILAASSLLITWLHYVQPLARLTCCQGVLRNYKQSLMNLKGKNI